MIIQGDCMEVMRDMTDASVQCCVTSPPYWGLRDYGHDGQLGLEQAPEEYVAKMVEVFREVRRVLRDDGTLWLNLGTSYAGSWGNYGGKNRGAGSQRPINSGSQIDHKAYVGRESSIPPTAAFGGKNPSRSPLLQRVPACGSDGTESQGSQSVDRACPDSCGEPQGETQSRRGRTARNGRSAEPAEQQTLQIGRDSERSDCAQASPDVLLPGVPLSNTPSSPLSAQDASFPEATVSASPSSPDSSSPATPGSEYTTACTSGTSPMLPPLVVRTQGKESFFSACGRSDCRGIGRCGLCWCSLAIPSLNIKPKDEVNIPHLVAMALQADGWVLRQTIIWHKPNPMPEPVRDRCTKAHEYIFLLSKSFRYYFDAKAIAEPSIGTKAAPRFGGAKYGDSDDPKHATKSGNEYRDNGTRNKRSVWTVTSKPFKGAHFAVFPPDLIGPCILAGCPEGGTVLDPFTGSGTTGEVAAKYGRRFVGCELNPEYTAIAEKRIANETRQMKLWEAV